MCGTGIKGPGRSVETVCEGREEKAYRKALICSKILLYLQVCTQSACIRVESAPAFGVMISPPPTTSKLTHQAGLSLEHGEGAMSYNWPRI